MKYRQNILIMMVFLVIIFNGINLVHTHPATAKTTSENQLIQPLKVNKITTAENTTVMLKQNVTVLLIITNVDQYPVSNVSFTDTYNKNYFTVMNSTGNAVENKTTVSYSYSVIEPNQTVVFSTTINFSGNQTTAQTNLAGFIAGTNITFYNMYRISSWIKTNSLQFTVISTQNPIVMRPTGGLFSFSLSTQEADIVNSILAIITIIVPVVIVLLLSRYWSAKKRMKIQE